MILLSKGKPLLNLGRCSLLLYEFLSLLVFAFSDHRDNKWTRDQMLLNYGGHIGFIERLVSLRHYYHYSSSHNLEILRWLMLQLTSFIWKFYRIRKINRFIRFVLTMALPQLVILYFLHNFFNPILKDISWFHNWQDCTLQISIE